MQDNHGFDVTEDNLDAVTLERCLVQLGKEESKSVKDRSAISTLMRETYVNRRNWIVTDRPGVKEVLELYPSLGNYDSVSIKIITCVQLCTCY